MKFEVHTNLHAHKDKETPLNPFLAIANFLDHPFFPVRLPVKRATNILRSMNENIGTRLTSITIASRSHLINRLTYLYLASLVVSVCLSLGLERRLPVALQRYLAAEYERGYTELEHFLLLGLTLFLLAHVYAAFALIRAKHWAPKILLSTTAGMYLLSSFLPPTIDHSLAYTVASLNVLILGGLFAVLFVPRFDT